MAQALRAGLRNGGLRRGGLRPGLGNGSLFAIAPLDLFFARNRTLDPRVTFTRASSGTYVGSDGVIKTATTNLLLRSEEFDNASWTLFGTASRSANATTAPNGSLTADSVTLPVASGIYQGVSGSASTSYTFSLWIRADSAQAVRLVINTNLSDPSVLTVTATTAWQRFSITKTTSVGTTFVTAQLDTGGGNTFYLWGAQLEQSSTVGEYIPTTSTINSAPRFDHNPTTGESLGLLVEEQRTNLLPRSEEIDNASWTQNNITVSANSIAAPTGATTAEKITETVANNEHNALQAVTVASNTAYTLTCFAKKGERNILALSPTAPGVSNYYTWFNLDAGTIGTSASGNTATITSVGNGWYRCSVSRTTGASQTTINVKLGTANSDGTSSYTGDGTSGVYIWGAQLEAGAFPTSYIPTTTATVTRSADVASITGTAFSSWYRQDEGTVFAETRQVGTILGFAFALSDGTDNNRIGQFRNGTSLSSRNVGAGVSANPGDITIATLQTVKCSIGSAANSCGAAANGTLGTGSTPSTLPTVDRLQIGLGAAQANPINGTLSRLTYWPARLSNSVLQTLTQ